MAGRALVKVDGLAAVQIVSGLFNLVVMSWAAGLVFSAGSALLGTLATCGCPLGMLAGVCGAWSLALVPLGILEIATGVLALTRHEWWGRLAPFVATAEVASLAFGGLGSFVAGLLALNVLREDEVQEALLEDRGEPPLE